MISVMEKREMRSINFLKIIIILDFPILNLFWNGLAFLFVCKLSSIHWRRCSKLNLLSGFFPY